MLYADFARDIFLLYTKENWFFMSVALLNVVEKRDIVEEVNTPHAIIVCSNSAPHGFIDAGTNAVSFSPNLRIFMNCHAFCMAFAFIRVFENLLNVDYARILILAYLPFRVEKLCAMAEQVTVEFEYPQFDFNSMKSHLQFLLSLAVFKSVLPLSLQVSEISFSGFGEG